MTLKLKTATASLERPFAMLPGFDNTPKVTDVPVNRVTGRETNALHKLTSAQPYQQQHSLMMPLARQLSH